MSIQVTKTFLPPLEDYSEYLRQIWASGQLTNQGPLLQQFEQEAKAYLKTDNFQFVANGTVALQLALSALDITEGEVITTPFSYVATTSAILWEKCKPVYVDIDPETLCIDTGKIEASITSKTKAILAVHVFGTPCDVEKIEVIAKRHNIKVIYDAAHAFGVIYKGRSLLSYGDISTCSFHATKVFHTIEGGALVSSDQVVSDKIELQKRFGHNNDEHTMLGINAKASEFSAAMGLCNLKYLEGNIKKRKEVVSLYDQLLDNSLIRPDRPRDVESNYAYYPVIFGSEEQLLTTTNQLMKDGIYPRRYFYPSLNTLQYLDNRQSCHVSEDISKRILCLPLYPEIEEEIIYKICEAIKQ